MPPPRFGISTHNIQTDGVFFMSNKEGYTEYGYRGLEEIRRLQEQVELLKKRIEQLESDDNEIDPDTFNPGGTD